MALGSRRYIRRSMNWDAGRDLLRLALLAERRCEIVGSLSDGSMAV